MAPNLLTNYFGRHNVKKIVIFSNPMVSDHSLVALLNAFFPECEICIVSFKEDFETDRSGHDIGNHGNGCGALFGKGLHEPGSLHGNDWGPMI